VSDKAQSLDASNAVGTVVLHDFKASSSLSTSIVDGHFLTRPWLPNPTPIRLRGTVINRYIVGTTGLLVFPQ
jgi:hypothetical protein